MAEVEPRRGREGSRWYNERPTGVQVAEWFLDVPLHDGMLHSDYVGGITMIVQEERSKHVAGFSDQGVPVIAERTDLVYVPYVKVETRVAYFWNLMREHRDWLGVIEPVESSLAENSLGLPPGFFRYSATKPGADSRAVHFVGCSMRVGVYERMNGRSERGREIIVAPPASKITAVQTRYDVDPNALMKAETGAIGRALGMAGMLVIPGSGVATAEDMLELGTAGASAPAPEPELPSPVEQPQGDDAVRARLLEVLGELEADTPDRHEEFQAWARGRNLTLDSLQGAALKGALKKAERLQATEPAPVA